MITREQMAAIALSYEDTARIDPWALPAVTTAVKDGIINGYPDGTFRPQGYATRAQAATVLGSVLK